MAYLKFNTEAFHTDLQNTIMNLCDNLARDFEAECAGKLSDTSAGETEYYQAVQESKNIISAKVLFGAMAIMESFGTGSKMDTKNVHLDEYMNSPMWNELRSGKGIVGRPPGAYLNIFGEWDVSEGKMAGLPVEHFVRPKPPNYAIQNTAKEYLSPGGTVERITALTMLKFVMRMGKYFYN